MIQIFVLHTFMTWNRAVYRNILQVFQFGIIKNVIDLQYVQFHTQHTVKMLKYKYIVSKNAQTNHFKYVFNQYTHLLTSYHIWYLFAYCEFCSSINKVIQVLTYTLILELTNVVMITSRKTINTCKVFILKSSYLVIILYICNLFSFFIATTFIQI